MFRLQSKGLLYASRHTRSVRHFSEGPSRVSRYWEIIKKECKKVWHGCKLLYHDGKFMVKTKYRTTFYEDNCTFEEMKNMSATTSDLLKMIPFSFFIVIPFAEFTLPFFLYIFPNMIPSAFLGKTKRDEVWKTMIEARSTHANKLHIYMLERMKALQNPQYANFLEKLRTKPQGIKIDDLTKSYEIFNKTLNFGNMDTDLLKATCRFLGMEPWTGFNTVSKILLAPTSKLLGYAGINIPRIYDPKIFPFRQIQRNIVMYQLRSLVRNLREEDILLLAEDIDTMKPELLLICCRERGIDTLHTTEPKMRKQLKEWIYYSTHPLTKGPVKNEILVFSQIFKYFEDTIEIEEHAEEPAEVVEKAIQMIFEESMDRILHYDKKTVAKILEQTEAANISQITDEERKVIKDKLEEALDEQLFVEDHDRIETTLKRLEDVPAEPVVTKAAEVQSSAGEEPKAEIPIDGEAPAAPKPDIPTVEKPKSDIPTVEKPKPDIPTVENAPKVEIPTVENAPKQEAEIPKNSVKDTSENKQ